MRSIMIMATTGAVAATIFATSIPAAMAAAACAERKEIVDKLGQQYSESRQSTAVTSEGSLLEIFVSREGTWSAILSSPNGRACVVAVGEAWAEETGTKVAGPAA